MSIALAALPVSVGFAIIRHRLDAIDTILN
jgi:hypothetical protein